ncbi:MAG: hypothetical protein ACKVQC_07080 [Elusimicrobiota bacterium]
MMKISILVVGLFSAFIFTSPIFSDVTIKSISRTTGGLALGGSEISSEEKIQGLKNRRQQLFKFNNPLMKLANNKTPDIVISRVDLDKSWKLNQKQRTYFETSLSEPLGNLGGMGEENPLESSPKEEKSTTRIKKTEFDVKKMTDKREINGYKTERYFVHVLMEVEDTVEKTVNTMILDTDLWVTPLTKTLQQVQKEQAAYNDAFLKKIGFPPMSGAMGGLDANSLGMLLGTTDGSASKTMSDMKKKMATIQGFPVVTESVLIHKGDPKVKKPMPQKETDDSIDMSNGAESVLGSFLGNMATNKVKNIMAEKSANAKTEPTAKIYYEVTSVSVAPIPDSEFDIPSGYKKE